MNRFNMFDKRETYPLIELNFESSKLDQKDNQTEKEVSENVTDSNELNANKPEPEMKPSRRNTDIIESVEVQDMEWLKRCLENDSNSEATCKETMMFVGHLAAYFGNVGILREVIGKRTDLFKRADLAGRTPMHYAAWQGHLNCLAFLLGLKAEDFSQDLTEKSNNLEEIRKFTIDKDKLLFLNSIRGDEVVCYDVCDTSHSCSKVTKILNAVWSGCTPLHEACARVQSDCVLGLLACGADITVLNAQGETSLDVLGLAFKKENNISELDIKGFENIIKAFIRYAKYTDCNKWLSNKDATSPLHIAIQLNIENATRLLLKHGADLKVKDEHGQTSLHLAVINKSTNILKCLINSHRASEFMEVLNGAKETPLQLAVFNKWFEGVSILLRANASITDQLNENKDSALHFAARAGNPEILEKLIKKLPDKNKSIDCKNKSGESPLFVAIKNGYVDCVECLLKEGASHAEILNGCTIIHKAIETDSSDVLKFLLKNDKIKTLNITKKNKGMTPLHWAALKGKADCTKILINNNANMTLNNWEGDTALHIAAENGHYEVIKAILEEDKTKPLVRDQKDKKDWLPFHRAANNCHRECIQLFLENGSNLAEIIPEENTLIIDIIKIKMPRPAEFLNHIFDNCIKPLNEKSFDHPESEIVLDYSILIPDETSTNQTQKDAIAALFSGNDAEINKLILHPLIQSFVLIKWNILKFVYLFICVLYFIFVVLFTDMTIQMYDRSQKIADLPGYFFIVIVIITIIMVVDAQVLLYTRVSRFMKYFWRLKFGSEIMSEVVKYSSLIMTIIIVSMAYENVEIPRLLVAITQLLCWLEVSVMVSRFQEVGYYSQMYFKVALKVITVFLSLGCFLIIGFSSTFWILKVDDSNSTFWNSLIKTIVMMTSEYDYSSMMESSITVNSTVVQILFFLFLMSVPIVFMTLLLALAITDVKDLINEGKIQRLIEQVVFIRRMELIMHENVLTILNKYVLSKNKLTVYPGSFSTVAINPSKGENILTRKIIECVLENINEKKKI